MLRFSPCLDIFFENLPFEKRLEEINRLGYRNFEFWTWWDKDVRAIKETAEEFNMEVAAFCTKFISLVDTNKRSAYLEGLSETINVAKELGNKVIISQVGDELKDVSRESQKEALIEGLLESAKLLEGTNLILAIEPLNVLYDHPGYFLSSSKEAYEIVNAVGSKNVKILFDIYHQQVTEGNLINNIIKYRDQIAHFHMADLPDRCEVGTGEINYPNVLKAIESTNFKGCVGIEFFPKNQNHAEVMSNSLYV